MAAKMYMLLIVEDEKPASDLYRTTFEAAGYDVVTASNGQAAIDYIKDHRPDVVILDILMAVTNGLTVLRAIRNQPATSSIPVIAVTNIDNFSIRDELVGLGITAYFVKAETKLEDIVKLVADVLQDQRTADKA